MGGLSQSLSDANKSGVEFLLVELDTVLTFMDVASVSNIEESVDRNNRHALEAYNTVLRHLATVQPDAVQQTTIDQRMTRLKHGYVALDSKYKGPGGAGPEC